MTMIKSLLEKNLSREKVLPTRMAKVRAVYEALDGRKHKLALKLLTPLLEKKPDNPQLRILKALALLRLGNKEEAIKIAREMKSLKEVENDEHLLNNLAIVFREGGSPAEATECFVGAWEKQPQNEDLGLCVFAAYGKERNFLRQQQVRHAGRYPYILVTSACLC
jgi:predicted Zn-dependent protease